MSIVSHFPPGALDELMENNLALQWPESPNDIPDGVRDLVEECMAFDPEDRCAA